MTNDTKQSIAPHDIAGVCEEIRGKARLWIESTDALLRGNPEVSEEFPVAIQDPRGAIVFALDGTTLTEALNAVPAPPADQHVGPFVIRADVPGRAVLNWTIGAGSVVLAGTEATIRTLADRALRVLDVYAVDPALALHQLNPVTAPVAGVTVAWKAGFIQEDLETAKALVAEIPNIPDHVVAELSRFRNAPEEGQERIIGEWTAVVLLVIAAMRDGGKALRSMRKGPGTSMGTRTIGMPEGVAAEPFGIGYVDDALPRHARLVENADGSAEVIDVLTAKGILAEVDSDGVFNFKVNAVGAEIRGTEMFDMTLAHFGKRVKAVRGAWEKGDNLAMINKLVSEDWMLEDAVLETWTAHRAADYGFTKARVVQVKFSENPSKGKYSRVEVIFERR